MRSKNRKLSLVLHLLLLILGLSLIAFSALRLWDWYVHTQGEARPPNAHKTITISTDTPDEKPIAAGAAYNVPADQPRQITIPSIATEGFIQPVGKDQYNQVGVPTNIHFAGWYVEAVKPGEVGLSVIDGHVSSRYGLALFAKLGSVRQNDSVQVQFGDGSVRHFQVLEKRLLSEFDAAHFLLTKRGDVERQLNLVTCGGTFNKKSDKYNNRLIVITKRVD